MKKILPGKETLGRKDNQGRKLWEENTTRGGNFEKKRLPGEETLCKKRLQSERILVKKILPGEEI